MKEYEMAYDEAVQGFRHIDQFIPDDIWLTIGGKIDKMGKKIKRRKLGSRERIEMDYKKSVALIPVFRDVIRKMPPKGKLYSKPWLLDLFKTLTNSRSHFLPPIDLSAFPSAPEADKQIEKECMKWLKKFKEHLDHWRSRRVDLKNEYRLISHMTLTYQYFLKQRDRKGVGSFIDVNYEWY